MKKEYDFGHGKRGALIPVLQKVLENLQDKVLAQKKPQKD